MKRQIGTAEFTIFIYVLRVWCMS